MSLFSAWHTNEQGDFILIGLPSNLHTAKNICQLHFDALITQEAEELRERENVYGKSICLEFSFKPIDRFEASLTNLISTPLNHLYRRKYQLIPFISHPVETPSMMRCLVVASSDPSTFIIESVLKRSGFYVCSVANSEEALKLILTDSFDIILCDVQLPGLNGLNFARIVVDIRPDIAVTLMSDDRNCNLMEALSEFSEVDFIEKPFKLTNLPDILLGNCKRRLESNNEKTLSVQPEMLQHANLLLSSLNIREPNTAEHSKRVSLLAIALGEKLGLNALELLHLRCAALLHDIGKVGVKDSSLLKTTELTEEDWVEIRKHPAIGAELLNQSPALQPLMDIVLRHHERFDGKGYPDGLKGTEIPFLARIVSVADAYEAMTSDRFYRDALSESEAKLQLAMESGKQFDPDIVAVFLKCIITPQAPYLMKPPYEYQDSQVMRMG